MVERKWVGRVGGAGVGRVEVRLLIAYFYLLLFGWWWCVVYI